MKKAIALFGVLVALPAAAQQPQPYAPPSEALWNQMVTALDGVAMQGPANRQVMSILQEVQRQAAMESARAKVPKEEPKK
jgi:hypothetical protein